MDKLSIVVPAYNEVEHIDRVVLSLLSARDQIRKDAQLSDVEVIIVDDGSTDGTGEKLETLAKASKGHLQVVTHEMNCGYGAALKTGFQRASGTHLSFMDADGTLAPDSLIVMYKTLRSSRADMVVGTRFGIKGSKMPFLRKLGNRFFAGLLSFLSGEKVRDTASGIRLFRRDILPQLSPLPDGLHFTPAMSSKAVHEKLKVVEVPISYSERSGDSKLRMTSDGIRFLKTIVGTVLMYNPFKVFLLVGLLLELGAGLLISTPLYALLTEEHVRFSDYIYRSIGGMYFFTAGVQIMLFGILARFIVSIFFRRHETGHLIHKLNRTLRVYDTMGWYGLGVFGVGVVINGLYFWKYLFGGGLEMHWVWLLFAAGFIIVGLQMMITGVVMRILKDIRAANDSN
ncbi:MAG TPA: glycosyltransferase family 2 protein [Bdellovibrionota bacterium]|nr:glycosyltransferase family 2 protein [Bdellovibrionota bacterium]